VTAAERRYDDGSEPRILDIIDVPLAGARPNDFQPENWVIDKARSWRRVGAEAPSALRHMVDRAGSLWLNGWSSSLGRNDRIPEDRPASLESSLRLIEVPSLELDVLTTESPGGAKRRRVRGSFDWDGESYAMWVTDPQIEDRYFARADGAYRFEEAYLTISLGTPFHGHSYKLVAAVIPKGAGATA
jgi:hypothetical protein